MSTNGVDYILGCAEFGDEQWARLIDLRVERMKPHLKDIAVTKFGSAPLLRSKPGSMDMWVGIHYRREPGIPHHILDVRGIPYVVRDELETWEGPTYNAVASATVTPDQALLFGLRQDGGWALINVAIERKSEEFPLRLDYVRLTLTPQEIAERAGVSLAWIYQGLLLAAGSWHSARRRLLEDADILLDALSYEQRVVRDVYQARKRGSDS